MTQGKDKKKVTGKKMDSTKKRNRDTKMAIKNDKYEQSNGSHITSAKATVRGAISIVNAIATKKGATIGIELEVNVEIRVHPGGNGIIVIRSGKWQNLSPSSRLIQSTIQHTVPKKMLESNKVEVTISSEIPAGFGLKSSSSISSAIALASAHAFGLKLSDQQILLAGVKASLAAKVSVTGAYDDACSCYYGGINVTNNASRRIIRHQRAPRDMSAIIFIPRNRKRGNIKKLKLLKSTFENAWRLARQADYWNAMTINGLAAASVLKSDVNIIPSLIEKGALAVSVSGNGPAIAAVVKNDDIQKVKKIFASMEGNMLISKLNNKKAEVNDIL